DAAREASNRDLELRREMQRTTNESLMRCAFPGCAKPRHALYDGVPKCGDHCLVGFGSSIRWIPDHDNPESVDDLFAGNADIHLERMNNNHYWIGITINGETHHFDLHSKRKIICFPRQPSPAKEPK